MKVLVVDDEPIITRSIERSLMLLKVIEKSIPNLEVISYDYKECGKDVIEFLEKDNEINYAILDILLNGISGLDIAKKLKTLNPQTPILFLTGCSESSSIFSEVEEFKNQFNDIEICIKPNMPDGTSYIVYIVNKVKELSRNETIAA